jgi:hypothetical protein
MTPSRILSLFDPMLPYETVCMCLSAYLGPKEDESASNPLISPIAASDEVLSKFPSSTLVAAQVLLRNRLSCFEQRNPVALQLDPLLDDSTLMSRRLDSLGVSVKQFASQL